MNANTNILSISYVKPLADVGNSYCVRRHMFFTVTNPIMEENLTKEEAEKLCKELNDDEQQNGDGLYVHYEVHNCC